jgi:hypothetical protein
MTTGVDTIDGGDGEVVLEWVVDPGCAPVPPGPGPDGAGTGAGAGAATAVIAVARFTG